MLLFVWILLIIFVDIKSTFYDGIFLDENECECRDSKSDCCETKSEELYNSLKIYKLITKITEENYFRYYKVNLDRECQLWPDERQCILKNCNIDKCSEDELPPVFKNSDIDEKSCSVGSDLPLHTINTDLSQEQINVINKIGTEDKSIDFIDIKGYLENSKYIDLVKNPERYTGYAGQGSLKVWKAIFEMNCLTSKELGSSQKVCKEFKLVSVILSGFRTSVGIHASSRYPLESNKHETIWGINYDQLYRRYSPEHTNNQSIYWIHDVFVAYVIVKRAIIKSFPLWKYLDFNTGSENEGQTKSYMLELFKILNDSPASFKEHLMFEDSVQNPKLYEDIRKTFQNISDILDCVACDKCRLWGKVQIQGLATALKILFTQKDGAVQTHLSPAVKLSRIEFISLINLFSRLSTSLKYLNQWRSYMIKYPIHEDL